MKKINPVEKELWFLKMDLSYKDGGKMEFQMENVEMCWLMAQ